jgi:hypothetical protein
MKIEWTVLAEGLALDTKGAVSLIGVNQSVFGTPTLPAMTKRAILSHIMLEPDESLGVGDRLTFGVRISSPSGKVIAASSGAISIGGVPQWSELPTGIDIPAELSFVVEEYGTHRFEIEFTTPEGEKITDGVSLYVIAPTPPPESQ